AGPAQHFDAADLRAQRLGLVGGSVDAAVVDDQDVCIFHRGAELLHQRHDVLDLVDGGDRYPHSHVMSRGLRATAKSTGVSRCTSSRRKKWDSSMPDPIPVLELPSSL